MKIGVRKPNIKSRIKARTTGKLKRKVKKSINPLYGKKGMGYLKNPKRAVYNKVYKKTTVGVPIPIPTTRGGKKSSGSKRISGNTGSRRKALLVWSIIIFAIGAVGMLSVFSAENVLTYIVACVVFMLVGVGLFLLYFFKKGRMLQENESIDFGQDEAGEGLTICPHCGAASEGMICEYCGMKKE